MNVPKIAESLSYIDEALISDAAEIAPKKKSPWMKWAAMAACLCLVIAGGALLPRFLRERAPEYPKSVTLGISEEIHFYEATEVVYTEEELFAAKGLYAFRGKVKKLQNITIDLNGKKKYFCVAEIRVKEVYAGELVVGEKIKMLLPYVETNSQSADAVSKLKKGIEGIFMPQAYNENAYIEYGNMRVHLNEIASCGLKDGKYWMFLEDEGQLFYEKQAYTGAYSAGDLDDIESYVLKMLSREYTVNSPADGAIITDRPSMKLESFTEEDMFGLDGIYVFRGEVVGLVNASFDLIDYSLVLGIAEVRVDRVYKGDIALGEKLKLLLPCALGADNGTGVVGKLAIGEEGIFMSQVLAQEDKIGNGTVYYLAADYADCTLGDGERWVFLETPEGLVYDGSAYPGARGAVDLDGIEEYVLEMLK